MRQESSGKEEETRTKTETVLLGIYEVDRKRLRVCWHRKGVGGRGRPKAFESKMGSYDWLMVFEKR